MKWAFSWYMLHLSFAWGADLGNICSVSCDIFLAGHPWLLSLCDIFWETGLPAQFFRFWYGTLFSFDAISSSRRNLNQPDLQGRSPWAGVGPEGTFIIFLYTGNNLVIIRCFKISFVIFRFIFFHCQDFLFHFDLPGNQTRPGWRKSCQWLAGSCGEIHFSCTGHRQTH